MKYRINILLLFIIGSSFTSCSVLNLAHYYYPIDKEGSTKIYIYVNPNNQELTEYWKVTSNPSDKSLLTESFNANFQLYNKFKKSKQLMVIN